MISPVPPQPPSTGSGPLLSTISGTTVHELVVKKSRFITRVSHVDSLTDAETVELATFTQTAMRVIRRASGAHGFNLGMNQGSVAGAGIAAHLHQHIVPRWGGDTNFMPVVGRTKVLPQLLGDTRKLLASVWE